MFGRQFSLTNRNVLITGGSRGLGLLLAREFGRHGANVAICCRDAAELERAKADLIARGVTTFGLVCDVADGAAAADLVAQVTASFGSIDVLVNNAGIIQVGPLENQTVDDFSKAMATHYWGPLHTILAVLPQMRSRQEGRIVNIASIGGKISVPHMLPYSGSKFALVGLSTGLTVELRKDGIYVTTVCPGIMRTGSPRNATFKGQHRAEFTWFSLSSSLPFISMNADCAARRIVSACRRGRAEVFLSVPTMVAVKFQALFPGLTAGLLSLVNRLLPKAGGIGKPSAKGRDSTTQLSPSWLTTLNEQAAARNNEMEATTAVSSRPVELQESLN